MLKGQSETKAVIKGKHRNIRNATNRKEINEIIKGQYAYSAR
jgi:hypothetical protein